MSVGTGSIKRASKASAKPAAEKAAETTKRTASKKAAGEETVSVEQSSAVQEEIAEGVKEPAADTVVQSGICHLTEELPVHLL